MNESSTPGYGIASDKGWQIWQIWMASIWSESPFSLRIDLRLRLSHHRQEHRGENGGGAQRSEH
jgi:hypothetical protein